MGDFVFGARFSKYKKPSAAKRNTPCCPECGQKVRVRKDGLTSKHRDASWNPCHEGSGVTPVMKASSPALSYAGDHNG